MNRWNHILCSKVVFSIDSDDSLYGWKHVCEKWLSQSHLGNDIVDKRLRWLFVHNEYGFDYAYFEVVDTH